MKRLIGFLAPLVLAVHLQAAVPPDTITTGDIGLLQAATGQVDTERHLIDKINVNFQIIVDTMTTNIADILNKLDNSAGVVFSTHIADHIVNPDMTINIDSGTFISSMSAIWISASSTVFRHVPYVWPSDDGTNNQRLTTDGGGVLSWQTVTGGGGGGGGALVYYDGTLTIGVSTISIPHVKALSGTGHTTFYIYATSGNFVAPQTDHSSATFKSTVTFENHIEFLSLFETDAATQAWLWYSTATNKHGIGHLNFKTNITTPTLQIGFESWIPVFNDTDFTITNGSAVYITGSSEPLNLPTIGLANSSNLVQSRAIGLATHDIPSEGKGIVAQFGFVNDLNVDGRPGISFNPGDELWVDANDGAWTSTAPVAPNFSAFLGFVITIGVSSGTILLTNTQESDAPAGDASEIVIKARKGSGGTINIGQAIYVSGYNVGQGVPLVELADANGSATFPAIGIAREALTNSSNGDVVVFGRIGGQNTSGDSSNDTLFLSETAGALTTTRPTGANSCIQAVGRVLRGHASQGVIEVVGAGRCNDIPNLLNVGGFGIANSTGLEIGNIQLTTVLSTITTGIAGKIPNTAGVVFSTMIADHLDNVNGTIDFASATFVQGVLMGGATVQNELHVLGFSSFSHIVYASSNVVIQSTSNLDIPLVVGPGGLKPESSNVTMLIEDSDNALGITRLAIKNPVDHTELILGVTRREAQIGTITDHPLDFRVGDAIVMTISTGLTSLTQANIQFTGSDMRIGIYDSNLALSRRPSSRFEIEDGSITVRGDGAHIGVAGNINAVNEITASSFTATSSMTTIWISYSSAVINNLAYTYPGALCTNGQVWKADGNGEWTCEDDNDTGGGSSDNMGTHVSTKIATFDFGLTVSTIVADSSATIKGVIISTTGALLGGATIQGRLVLSGAQGATVPDIEFVDGSSAYNIFTDGQNLFFRDEGLIQMVISGNANRTVGVGTAIPQDASPYGFEVGGTSFLSGDVGIGVEVAVNPSSRLDVVNGSITVRGAGAHIAVAGNINAVNEMTASSFTATSSMTTIWLSYSSAVVNNVPMTYPSVKCTNGQVWKADGNGAWTCEDDATAAAGTPSAHLVGSYDGDAVTKFSTMSIIDPFGGIAIVANSVQQSSFTILGGTNPYRTTSIPAASWVGVGPSSASWGSGGVAVSYTTAPYNRFGEFYHEFRNSTYSFATADFRMPYEWDGSSIGAIVSWFASTGTENTNVVWSLGGVALSSGDLMNQVVIDSGSVVSTWNGSSHTFIDTNEFAVSIENAPKPGSRVKLYLTVSGGDGRDTFIGIPKMLEVVIFHRVALWDGKRR